MASHILSKRHRQALNPWPMFVDMLSAVLMVIIFILMTFMVSQLYLSDAISDRDCRLRNLHHTIETLQLDMKNITKERNEKHQELQSLSTQLQSLQKDLAQLSSTLRTEQDTHQKTNDKNRTLAQEIQILNDRLKNINDLLNETQRVISEKDDLLMKTKKDLNKNEEFYLYCNVPPQMSRHISANEPLNPHHIYYSLPGWG